MFSIHFVKKDLHIRTNIDILVPKFQFKISYTICVIFCINPFVIFPPCCRIVTFASTHIPHSKCTVYDNDLIFASWLHHRRWSASNQRTYLKFLEMTFLVMDCFLVKENSIYNIFEIWVFSSLLMYTSIYILKMVTTPWALYFVIVGLIKYFLWMSPFALPLMWYLGCCDLGHFQNVKYLPGTSILRH